jgi:hemerythrin superfamily protein
MTFLAGGDLIDVLYDQHLQIKNALARVESAVGSDKEAAFAELRSLLHAHEMGEQEIVHPATRDFAGEGDIASALLAEEQDADEALAQLSALGTTDGDFDARFAEFRAAVLAHAEHEEQEEFPALRASLAPEQLVSLGAKLLSADAQAG